MIEAALILPLFLSLVIFALGYSYWNYSKDNMQTAVVKGVRAGITRGNSDLTNKWNGNADDTQGIIGVINNYCLGGQPWTPEFSSLFKSPNVSSTDAEALYNQWTSEVYNASFQQMPPEAIYALFYTLEGIRISMAGMAKFPCDPDYEDSCMKCSFASLEDLGCGTKSSPDTTACQFRSGTIPIDRVGIRCTYRPMNELSRLIGTLGGPLNLRLHAFYAHYIELPDFG